MYKELFDNGGSFHKTLKTPITYHDFAKILKRSSKEIHRKYPHVSDDGTLFTGMLKVNNPNAGSTDPRMFK